MIYRFVLIACLLLAACGQQTAAVPTETPTAESEPTATAAPPADTPPDTPEGRGEVLFKTVVDEIGFACITCHYPNTEARFIGPGLANLSTRFETYGLSVAFEEYIRTSIVEPSAFIVPDEESPYPPNVMPRNYAEIFTEDELNDLVAFILSL